jgi:hypothetical protein
MAGNRKSKNETPSRKNYHAEGRKEKNKKIRQVRHQRNEEKRLQKREDVEKAKCSTCKKQNVNRNPELNAPTCRNKLGGFSVICKEKQKTGR